MWGRWGTTRAMTDAKKEELVTGVPIIGQERHEYWVGSRTETDPQKVARAMLTLSITPKEALQGFAHYAHERGKKNLGLPAPLYFTWVFTSLSTEALWEENKKLTERIEELETHVGSLEDRLTALEADQS